MNTPKVIEMSNIFGEGQTGQLVYCGKIPEKVQALTKEELNKIPGIESLSWNELNKRLEDK